MSKSDFHHVSIYFAHTIQCIRYKFDQIRCYMSITMSITCRSCQGRQVFFVLIRQHERPCWRALHSSRGGKKLWSAALKWSGRPDHVADTADLFCGMPLGLKQTVTNVPLKPTEKLVFTQNLQFGFCHVFMMFSNETLAVFQVAMMDRCLQKAGSA